MATSATVPSGARRAASYWSTLKLLTGRDLRVRYATSALGYLWSILDPLLMSLIYWFIFTQVFQRPAGTEPYIVFLLTALLPWVWFNGAVSDMTRAFLRDVKLVRSVSLPRSLWVNRVMLAKGVEFLLSIPIVIVFAIFAGAQLNWLVVLLPLAVLIQGALISGIGLIVAPLVVFFRDLERATKLILRALFYASPIIYGLQDLPGWAQPIAWFNPLSGIFSLYRAAFFPEQLDWALVAVSAGITAIILAIGVFVFRRSIGTVLKEL